MQRFSSSEALLFFSVYYKEEDNYERSTICNSGDTRANEG
jgi:hypothetical protein